MASLAASLECALKRQKGFCFGLYESGLFQKDQALLCEVEQSFFNWSVAFDKMFALARKLSVSKANALMFNAILDFMKAKSILKRWTYAINVPSHILFMC